MSAEVHEFITGLRERLEDLRVAPECVDAIVEEILAEYERLPGPIRGIASGTLLEWGYLDALLEGPS